MSLGTVEYRSGRWHLKVEPHVAIRVKRIFGKVERRRRGELVISATEENCRDLEWLLTRYDLQLFGDDGHTHAIELLKRGARAFDERVERSLRIMDDSYEGRDVEMALPPRHYQVQAADLCRNNGGLLVGDVVGLGKTVTALTLIADPKARPALIVAQAHLAHPTTRRSQCQWEREVERFLPGLHVHTLKKGDPYELPKLFGRDPDVLIASYHKLGGWADYLAGKLKTVVFDEVQELRTGRSSTKGWAASRVAEQTRYRMGLSATPIFNLGGEFYNLYDVLAPNVLGTRGEFHIEWCQEWGYQGKAKLKDPEAFGSYLRELGIFIRRTRKDVGGRSRSRSTSSRRSTARRSRRL